MALSLVAPAALSLALILSSPAVRQATRFIAPAMSASSSSPFLPSFLDRQSTAWSGADSLVSDHMTSANSLVTLTETQCLADAARILEASRITGAPVIDAEGNFVGVLSRNDILFKIAGRRSLMLPGHGPRTVRYMENTARLNKIESQTVGESMSRNPITIGPSATMRDAAALMLRRKLNRVIVSSKGKLVGLVSSTDVFHLALRDNDDSTATSAV
eukprot:CAMPEP_0183354960 /NCGR_PEP_ID=MMETSP0164_2-20130417/38638_1 /TAXON_ID=221442 /ORGANISM="Coccolithus pelagicus ssp braarudi, Strain PLY182g" /LENGTH=215 /DNA_ID=CAMNT_0025527937 /DNA_START=12 /DNA_END=659 /DNA_ORIENTATION=+